MATEKMCEKGDNFYKIHYGIIKNENKWKAYYREKQINSILDE